MKFLILVNQKAVIENALDLDIIDCAIFDCVKDFAHSPKCRKFMEGEKIYYWFSYTLIKDQLPILKGQSKKSIQRRLDNLVNAKILERHPENQKNAQSFFCFGENYPLVIFDQDKPKMTKTLDKNDSGTWSFLADNDSTKDKFIKNKSVASAHPRDLNKQNAIKATKEKSSAKKERYDAPHLFRESPYFDQELFIQALQNLEPPLHLVNLHYYYKDLLHDSDSHQRKVHDWLAYAQKWMLKAHEMGILQTLSSISSAETQTQTQENTYLTKIIALEKYTIGEFSQAACESFLNELRELWRQTSQNSLRQRIEVLSEKAKARLLQLEKSALIS
jgi:hypothetical protein